MDAKLEPVERSKSLKEQAYDKIKQAILNGEFKTTFWLSESQIAKALTISRTPVREALLLLEKEGLVKSLPQRGVLLLKLTQERLDEVFKLRRALETMTVEDLAESVTPEEIKKLRSLLERQRKFALNQSREAFLDVDEEFHLLMPELARLPKTREIIKNLRDQIRMVGFEALAQPGRMQEVIREHEQIIDALGRGESEEARRVMLDHLSRTEEALALRPGEAETS